MVFVGGGSHVTVCIGRSIPCRQPGAREVAKAEQYDTECRLCVEINSFEDSLFAQRYPGVLQRNAFFETSRLQVMIPVGPFCEGHLLIAAREHEWSFAHLGRSIVQELEELIAKVTQVIEGHWLARVVVFEHGPMSHAMRGGCCLEHAHMNILPVAGSISVLDAALKCAPFKPVQLCDLEGFARRGEPYLFFMEPQNGSFATVAPTTTSQFFRRLLAAAQPGTPWDWRATRNPDAVRATKDVLLQHQGSNAPFPPRGRGES
jgi:ATP adenylyltransferase